MAFVYSGQTNDTCDIYRSGRAPPAAPDVAGVKVYVIPRFRNIHGDFTAATWYTYTHIMLMPLGTDVRDGFNAGGGDTLYLPDRTGPYWTVKMVGRVRLAGGNDYLEVYCSGPQGITGPTQEG